jgi:uncharacterized membrane protein
MPSLAIYDWLVLNKSDIEKCYNAYMNTFETLTLIATLSVMLVTVSLWVFSDFIMRGLKRKSTLAAVQAMQGINETVLRSSFIVLFMLNNVLLCGIAVMAFTSNRSAVLPIVAFCLYFFGVFLVTGLRNVPLNERLRAAEATNETDAQKTWGWYAKPWILWNTIRCTCGFATVAALIIVLHTQP